MCRINGEVSEPEQTVDITIQVDEKSVESGYFISGKASIQGFSFVVMIKTFSIFNYLTYIWFNTWIEY